MSPGRIPRLSEVQVEHQPTLKMTIEKASQKWKVKLVKTSVASRLHTTVNNHHYDVMHYEMSNFKTVRIFKKNHWQRLERLSFWSASGELWQNLITCQWDHGRDRVVS